MGLGSWLKGIFHHHVNVIHPASGATVSTSALTPIPASAIPTPSPVPASLTPSPNPYPVVVCGNVVCDDSEKVMIAEAFVHLNKVIITKEFHDQVLAAVCTETNGMTNQQVMDHLVLKSPIAVDFSMFTGSFMQNDVYKTMGYEDAAYPNTVFANRHFIQDAPTCSSLILHEVMHILGLHHYQVMYTSWPYTMNRIEESVTGEDKIS